MAGSRRSLAEIVVHRRALILAAWVVVCVALVPAARSIESVLSVAARIDGSESAIVEDQLARRFRSPFARSAVLVATGLPSPTTAAGEQALGSLVSALRSTPGITSVLSYLDGRESLLVGAPGTDGTFVIVGLEGERPDARLALLRDATRRLEGEMRRDYPRLALRWTGETALNADLRRASAADAKGAEMRALPVTLLLLLVAFGALTAALLPVAGGVLAIAISLGLASVVARVWPLSILLQNVVTMIGLGLGIDYSLLIVGRFRDEMRAGRERGQAAVQALRHAGPTIVLSGLAVAIGFGALATAPVNELRSVAVGGLLVTGVSILISTTLLPGLLAVLGARVDAGRLTFMRRVHPRWNGWANAVTRHPVRVLAICGLPVCVLAWQARRLSIDLPRGDWLPKEMESAVALRSLQTIGRGAVIQTVRLTLELPRGVSALDDNGWSATMRVARWLVADSAVQQVRSLPGIIAPMGSLVPRDSLIALLPAAVRRSFVSEDGRLALLEVVPREEVTPRALSALVGRLRAADTVLTSSAGRATLLVGGLPAFNRDYEHAVAGRFAQVVALIVGATFIVLAVGFRSVLVPLKAIVLNLLAVAAAFGAVTLVFQDGVGASLLGLDGPLDAIFPAIPVLVFCIVFGLSMDYEVFLVARVREARLAGMGEREAIAHGLSHTGGLITSAAAIMIVVFGAFMLGDFLLIKMLGFALAVAVLLDATVMRLAVSPALLTLAGRWNWWPGSVPQRSRHRCASRRDPPEVAIEKIERLANEDRHMNTHAPTRLWLAILLACASAPATAQRVGGATRDSIRRADSSVVVLAAVEVRTSIAPVAGTTVGSGVPGRIATIDGRTIGAWTPRVLADALATQPGVSLYDDLGSPWKVNLSTRGFNVGPTVGLPSGVTVFLDGVRQNEPDAQQVNFDLLPLDHVSRVELLSGIASLLGPNSLGGAINLVTNRGGGSASADVALSGGSFGEYAVEGRFSGRTAGLLDYYAGGGYTRERGWREETGAENANGFINLGRNGDARGFNVQAYTSRSRAETAGSLPESLFDAAPRTNFTAGDFEDLNVAQISLAGHSRIGAGAGAATAFLRRASGERFNVNQTPDPNVRSRTMGVTVGGNADWRRTFLLGSTVLSLRLGGDAAASAVRARIYTEPSDASGAVDDGHLTTDVRSPGFDVAGYVLADYRMGRLTASGGGRYDFVRIPFRNQLRPSDNTTNDYYNFSPRIGVSVDAGAGLSAYASAGRAFRAPAILELGCADPDAACPLPFALGDDPPLAPVRATTSEIGAQWRRGGFGARASSYRTDVQDEIFFVASEQALLSGYFTNLSRTRREGVEVSIDGAALRERVSWYASHVWTRATFRSSAEIFSIRADDDFEDSPFAGENDVVSGNRMPLVPGRQAKMGGELRVTDDVSVGTDIRYVGRQWLRGDEANATEPLGAYSVANVRVAFARAAWSVTAVATNVLDSRAATFGTFNEHRETGELARFLTPLNGRGIKISVRRALNGA